MGTIEKMKTQAKAVEVIKDENIVKREILERKQMSVESKYMFCPYCLKDGLVSTNDKTQATYIVTEKQTIKQPDGSFKPYFETYWHCNKCRRNLLTEDFVKFYVRPARELKKRLMGAL